MLNITSQWQDPEILIFCYKSILRKIRSHAENPYVQVLFWSMRPLKGYRRKTGPHEAENDSRYWPDIAVYLYENVILGQMSHELSCKQFLSMKVVVGMNVVGGIVGGIYRL